MASTDGTTLPGPDPVRLPWRPAEPPRPILVIGRDPRLGFHARQAFAGVLPVETVLDSATGWRRVREGSPRLVLAELEGPRLDALWLLRRLETAHDLGRVPVVILSGERPAEVVAGDDGELRLEPFPMEELGSRLRELSLRCAATD